MTVITENIDATDAEIVKYIIETHSIPMPIFIGSEVSACAGLPSQKTLLNEIAKIYSIDLIDSKYQFPDGIYNIYQYASFLTKNDKRGVKSATLKNQIARRISDSYTGAHRNIYNAIAAMGARFILSINYDNLLQQALLNKNTEWKCQNRGDDIGELNDDDLRLIAMWGHVDNPQTMVVTEDDHTRALSAIKSNSHITNLYKTKSILHVGIGRQDPSFHDGERQHIALVAADMPEATIFRLQDTGIVVFRRKAAELPALLVAIGAAWRQKMSDEAVSNVVTSISGKTAPPRFTDPTPHPYPQVLLYRAPILEEIYTYLCNAPYPHAILIGPAGCGKTSLATHLAHRAVNDETTFPGGVCWLNGMDSPETLKARLVSGSQAPQSASSRNELPLFFKRMRPLIIIDTVTFKSYDAILQILLNDLLHDCAVLLLAQDFRLKDGVHLKPFIMPSLTDEDALAVFEAYHSSSSPLPAHEKRALRRLVCAPEFFGGNPGPIVIAAQYIESTKCRISHYLDLLADRIQKANQPANAAEFLSVSGFNIDEIASDERVKRLSYYHAVDMSMGMKFPGEKLDQVKQLIQVVSLYADDTAVAPLQAWASYQKEDNNDISLSIQGLPEQDVLAFFRQLCEIGLVRHEERTDDEPVAQQYVLPHMLRRYAASRPVVGLERIRIRRMIEASQLSAADISLEKAERLYTDWEEIAPSLDNPDALTAAAQQARDLGLRHYRLGDYGRASELFARAQQLFQRLGDAEAGQGALEDYLMVAIRYEHYEQMTQNEHSIEQFHEITDNTSYLTYLLADHAHRTGKIDTANKYTQELLRTAQYSENTFAANLGWQRMWNAAIAQADSQSARQSQKRMRAYEDNNENNAIMDIARALEHARLFDAGNLEQARTALQSALGDAPDTLARSVILGGKAELLGALIDEDPTRNDLDDLLRNFETDCLQPVSTTDSPLETPGKDTAGHDGLAFLARLQLDRALLLGNGEQAVAAAQRVLDLARDSSDVNGHSSRGWLMVARLMLHPDDHQALTELRDIRNKLEAMGDRQQWLRLEVGEILAEHQQVSPQAALRHLLGLYLAAKDLGLRSPLLQSLEARWCHSLGVDANTEAEAPEVQAMRRRRLAMMPGLFANLPTHLTHPIDGRTMHLLAEQFPPVYIDEAPVTFGEYQTFLAESGYPRPQAWPTSWPTTEMLHQPVIALSQDEGRAFAHWRGQQLPTPTEAAVVVGAQTLSQSPPVNRPMLDPTLVSRAEDADYDHQRFVTLLADSLSLDYREKCMVLDALPSLSQFQVDELFKVFIDESVKFRELAEEHPDDIKKLQKQRDMITARLIVRTGGDTSALSTGGVIVEGTTDITADTASSPIVMLPLLYCVTPLDKQSGVDTTLLAQAPRNVGRWHADRLRERILAGEHQLPDQSLLRPHISALFHLEGHDRRALAMLALHGQNIRLLRDDLASLFFHNPVYTEKFPDDIRSFIDLSKLELTDRFDKAMFLTLPDDTEASPFDIAIKRVLLSPDLTDPSKALLLYGVLRVKAAFN